MVCILNSINQYECEKEDVFNCRNTHSEENDTFYSYNCMGYAFKCFGWFLPFGTLEEYPYFEGEEDDSNEEYQRYLWNLLIYDEETACENVSAIMDELGYSQDFPLYDEIYDSIYNDISESNYSNPNLINLAIIRILKSFPQLRLINSFDELAPDEYGITYACGCTDFHFVRYEDGVYSHKMGNCAIEIMPSEDSIFKDSFTKYDSIRIRFAKKKDSVGQFNF